MLLLDKRLQPVASIDASDSKPLSNDARQQLYAQMKRQPQGSRRRENQFISWIRLKNVDSYLVNQQTLTQGLWQDLELAMLFMLTMWLLFVLLLAHEVIVHLVRRLSQLSARLEWCASYDGLTRLLNRSAFFERFEAKAARCAAEFPAARRRRGILVALKISAGVLFLRHYRYF